MQKYDYVQSYKFTERNPYFFSPSTMRFFNSRVSQYGIKDCETNEVYFVSSERFESNPRRYTIRKMNTDNMVDDINGFGYYASSSSAWRALRRMLGL